MSYIKISNVSKNYLDGENVYLALKNINLEFDKNEFIAILGESGSGKSTLLNLLIGISEITYGNIYIKGENIKHFSNKRMNSYRRNEIGVIFQKYNLIDLYNIYENIDIVRNKNINKRKISKLLETIGIKNKKNNQIDEISGGELQRVAVIRALINNPSILLCDEPTGALDNENSEILMNYLTSIKKDKLIIFITHNYDLAKKYATRIIELKDGEVIKDSKNNSDKVVINEDVLHHSQKLALKYKFIFLKNLIFKKKGRFLIAVLSSLFLLFFISISLMAINVTNDYINYSFLSSLDANVLDLKSYKIENKELVEIELPTMIVTLLNKDNEMYEFRKNYNKYLNNNLLNKLNFKQNNKSINLNSIKIYCMSSYAQINLKMGKKPQLVNEVIINENLFNYLSNQESIINKRFEINNTQDYLKICGVSYSSLMNDSLIIYFDYQLINNKLDNLLINDYQIDIKDINNLIEIINDLKNSNFYLEREKVKDEINFSLDYSADLDNYYTFYELIRLAKVVVYLFLGLTIIISIMLLSNVIYSFNEEEKRNLALLKVLGFSFYDISFISILLSILITILSFFFILIINSLLNIYLSPMIDKYLNNGMNVNLMLTYNNYLIIFLFLLLLSIISSIFPLIKIYHLKLDTILKEE